MDTSKLLADAQQLVNDIQALTPAPQAKEVQSITVTYSDGSTQNFTPAQ